MTTRILTDKEREEIKQKILDACKNDPSHTKKLTIENS